MEKKSLIKIQFLLLVTLFIASCSTNTGKYYDNDGAPSSWQSFRISTEDAVPKIEKTVAATSRPYTVMGKKYYRILVRQTVPREENLNRRNI